MQLMPPKTAGPLALRDDSLDALIAIADKTDKAPTMAAADEAYWAALRNAFDVEPNFLYFNNGGCCPSPRAVQETVFKRLKLANQAPSYYLFKEMEAEVEVVRKRLAEVFGCDAEELAITPNASESLFSGILGAPVERGQTMVMSDKDYPRVVTGLETRGRRDGAVVKTISVPWVPNNEDDIACPLEAALADKPALLAFPQISFLNGMRFPADRICHAARANGVMTMVDGAHGIGHVEDTATSMQCDMYACSLHKWFLAPTGCGFLYVRRDRIKDVWPLYAADASLDDNIRKFEQFGTRPTPIPLGLNEAIDLHYAIGPERKGARLQYLRNYWTSQLLDHPGIRFHTPLDTTLSRALTMVEVIGVNAFALADWLFEKRHIYTAGIERDGVSGIRVTPQIYHTPAELDRFVAVLREAAENGIG